MKPLKWLWEGLTMPTSREDPMIDCYQSNYTPRAQQAMALAGQEADRLKHNFIGTEHLLLGIIRLGQGTAANVMLQMGLELESLRQEVENFVGVGEEPNPTGRPAYTPRVRTVLKFAAKEAKAFNHTYVGTEHLLLGFLREGEGIAGRVLKNHNVDFEVTRDYILRELDPNYPLRPKAESAVEPARETKPTDDVVDIGKRYDVYCTEGNRQVIYRNVRFQALKRLFPGGSRDPFTEFIELEQEDGQVVLVARSTVVKFCAPGVKPGGDEAAGR